MEAKIVSTLLFNPLLFGLSKKYKSAGLKQLLNYETNNFFTPAQLISFSIVNISISINDCLFFIYNLSSLNVN
ncbi:MAG TPA: hypothetical protein P5241_03670 [Candidatus Paceibacterota bacterium]|nr:hypothetical protein [Candidatus Paceibacterota bacterium]